MVPLDQLIRLTNAKSEAAWRDSLFALARHLGFDFVLFGVAASKQMDFESASVHSNYLQAWREHYSANKLYLVDPTVRHCLSSALPIVWSPEMFEGPKQRELYEAANSFGHRRGVTLPIHAPGGEVGMISFSTADSSIQEFDRLISHRLGDLSLVRDYAFESSRKYRGESGASQAGP